MSIQTDQTTAVTTPPSEEPQPYFPTVKHGKQGPLDIYRAVKHDRLQLATSDFYDAEFIRKNLIFAKMMWPLTEPGIKHVLRDNAANYERPSFARDTISSLEGDGLLSSVGDTARRLRSTVAGAFSPKYQRAGHDAFLTNNAVLMEEVGRQGKDRIAFDLYPLLSAWAVNLNIALIFSEDARPYNDTIRHLVQTRAEFFSKDAGFLFRLPKSFPTPARRRLWSARRTYLQVANELLQKRRQRPGQAEDLLGRLINAEDKATGETLTDSEIVDFTITFMSAGIESTATGITAILYLLALFPRVQNRVREEALSLFGGRDPGPDDFDKLVYTQAVVDEGLRYYPPIPITARQASADDETPFGRVKAGDLVMIFIWCIHHHARNWDAPRQFRPERSCPAVRPRCRPSATCRSVAGRGNALVGRSRGAAYRLPSPNCFQTSSWRSTATAPQSSTGASACGSRTASM